jgi:HSP20 family protein
MSRQTAIQTTKSNEIQVNSPQAQPELGQPQGWSYLPAIDVLEWNEKYTIECDAPGLQVDQIELTFENGVLHLHAPVAQRYSPNARFLRQEYGVGDFDRTMPLGRLAEFVDSDKISATYEAGVLTIHLPKLAKAQGRKIQVRSAKN